MKELVHSLVLAGSIVWSSVFSIFPESACSQIPELQQPAGGEGICSEKNNAERDDCLRGKGPSQQPKQVKLQKCAQKGETCGGIAGILCCPELMCKYDGAYPDASGVCVEQNATSK